MPDGRTTRYGYDAHGRKIRERKPDGREHRWVYNALGACTAESLPDGRTHSRRFDLLGRLIEEQRPDGSQWRYRYTPEGWPKDAISSTGEIRRTGFNDEGELLATTHQGHLARQVFDGQGRLKGRLQADRVTEYDYSGQHLSAIHQYPEQAPQERRSRFYQHDPAGRLTRFTTATGDSHGFHYDGLARPIAYQRPDGKQVAYQYDKEQRLTGVTRADGQQWSLNYDSKGQVSRCQAPDGRDIVFSYDAGGDIIQRQQGDDWVQHLTRDAGGRILKQDTEGRDRQSVHKTFTYDPFGRRTRASCQDHTLAWRYDAHGRVTEHRQNSHAVQYRYGAGPQLKALQLPDGTEIQYHHDRYGRWQSLLVNGKPVVSRELDDQGREAQRSAGDNQQTQTWDRYDCLKKRQWQGKETRQRDYHWDAESRLTHFSDEHQGEHHFHRDPQGQLTGEDDRQYNYDDGGNRLPEFANTTGLSQDQLTATPEAKRRYDTLGAEIAVLGTTIEHRHFDAEGQLVSLKREALEVRYGYDALGRRAWRQSDEGTTNYLWHNDVLLGEQHPSGEWQWYIRDPDTDAPLFTLIKGTPYHYELDWRGMPIRLWAEDGALVWQANADAWGKCSPQGNVHQPIRLPGQFEDELTGLYFNRFRDYDAETGRYLTPDPLGIKGGLNSYQYTKNPVDYVDPLGLKNESVVTVANAEEGEEAPVSEEVASASELQKGQLTTLEGQEPNRTNAAIPVLGGQSAPPGTKVDSVWHVTSNPGAAQGVLSGIDPKYLNPDSRFGAAFYVAEQQDTAIAELAHHGVEPTHSIRFDLNKDAMNTLDLTDPEVAREWGYDGGPISPETQAIGEKAQDEGFNVVRFKSERADGGVNNAVLDDYNEILKPKMITPVE